MAMTGHLLAAIEAGGTKFVCAVGRPGQTSVSVEIPTRAPSTTLNDIRAFFTAATGTHGNISALGIASFGPIGLNPASPDYGRLTTTPKPGWSDFDLLAALRDMMAVPTAIDTDVNAAALAEAQMGAAQNCDPVVYVTVGTGIGVGVYAGGAPIHGIGHPEGGHIWPRRHPAHQAFTGICPYHGDCLEGLASGTALAAAWGCPADVLPADHPAWEAEADYLGQLCATLILMLAPQRIVLGGGVMKQSFLYPLVRTQTQHWLNGYPGSVATGAAALDRLIVAPGCVQPSGLAGAFLLAEDIRLISQGSTGAAKSPTV